MHTKSQRRRRCRPFRYVYRRSRRIFHAGAWGGQRAAAVAADETINMALVLAGGGAAAAERGITKLLRLGKLAGTEKESLDSVPKPPPQPNPMTTPTITGA
jgi:hypothetical protein